MRDAQNIKNPDARWERMERLTDKFARLQNAYNWSRRVGLEYDKYNHQFKPEEEQTESDPESSEEPEANDEAHETGDRARPERGETSPRVSPLDSTPTEHSTLPEPEKSESYSQTPKLINSQTPNCPLPLSNEEPQTLTSDSAPTAPKPEKPESHSQTPKLLNSQTTPNFHPIPTLAPTPQPPNPNSSTPKPINSLTPQQPPTWKTHKVHSIPIRGRRFTCIEG